MMFKILAITMMVGGHPVMYESLPIFPSKEACEKYIVSLEYKDIVAEDMFGVTHTELDFLGKMAFHRSGCVPEKRSLD